MTQEEFKKFDEFQKKHFAYINGKLYDEMVAEDPNWDAYSYTGSLMQLQSETLYHIKRMYEFGYISAEQYWSELEKTRKIENKIDEINSMFPDSQPTKMKESLKKMIQDSLADANGFDDFVIEWEEIFNEEYTKKRIEEENEKR